MRLEDQGYALTEWAAVASATNAVATATKAAPAQADTWVHCVTSISVSANGAPTAPVTVTLTSNGVTLDQLEIPAAAFAPIQTNYTRPILCAPGSSVALSATAGGASVKFTVVVRGYTRKA